MLLNPGEAVRLQRPRAALSRHQAGLLGGRQPVPSSPGHQPAAARLQRPANHRRARERLDADGEIRRHRAAGDHDAGARRHRRRRHRSKAGRDAQGRRPDRRSARRFRYFCRAVASGWASNRPSRRAATAGNGWRISTSRRGARLPMPAAMRPTSKSSGGAANSRCRQRPMTAASCAPSATIPTTTAADAERQDRDPFESHRGLRLRRLPAAPGLAALDRTAECAPPVDADRQPAGDAAAQPARFRRLQPVQENRRPRSRASQPRRCGARGIADGDIVRLFNDRGACLAAAAVTDDVMRRRGATVHRRLVRSGSPVPRNIRSASTAIRTC